MGAYHSSTGICYHAGKQHDALKKKTRDKTLESTLKASINTKLPTCDDKGVFTEMMMTHTGTQVAYGGRSLVAERVWRRWLSHGLTQWL